MDNFKVIYRILRALERNMDNQFADMASITPDELEISYGRWEQLMIMLQKSGYIDGVDYVQLPTADKPSIVGLPCPMITLKGLEYLAKNSLMKEAGDLRAITAASGAKTCGQNQNKSDIEEFE